MLQVTVRPDSMAVLEDVSITVEVVPDRDLPAGTAIECQLPNSLLADKISQSFTKRLQTEDPAGRDFVHVWTGIPMGFELAVVRRDLRTGSERVRHARCARAVLLEKLPFRTPVCFQFANTSAPWVAGADVVYVAVDGEKAAAPVRVHPGPAAYTRLLVPSWARPGQPFRCLLVSLDAHHNVSASAFRGVDLRVENGPALREGISFTGRWEGEVALDEPGVYRLEAVGVTSNPIRVDPQVTGPFWGDIHIHSDLSDDGLGAHVYPYARDASGLDFAAAADHGSIHVPVHWRRTLTWCREYDQPGRFVALPGFEFGAGYHLNVYFFTDGEEATPRETRPSEEELATYLKGRPVVSGLHHSGINWGAADMRRSYHESACFLEIYSSHGQSEYYCPDHFLAYETNRLLDPEQRVNYSKPGPYYAQDAWALGKRYGTLASSDDHFAQGGKYYRGVAAAYAGELTRQGILEAIQRRATYGTTGERVILEFGVNGHPMGSELTAAPGDKLELRVRAWGTDEIARVEVLKYAFRGGRGWETIMLERPQARDADVVARDGWDGPTVYYARLRQRNLVAGRPVMAWSSPIWVDARPDTA